MSVGEPPGGSRLGRAIRALYTDVQATVPFTPGEEDIRIERDDHVYYVRAVRKGRALNRDTYPWDLVSAALYIVLGSLFDASRSRRPWKVGVVRHSTRGIWRPVDVVQEESLTAGQEPTTSLTTLASRVKAGDFDSR